MTNIIASIGELWEEGERKSVSGDVLGGLLNCLKAKNMLIEESKNLYTNTNSNNASKLLGELLQRLTKSIERDFNTIKKHPNVALGLGSMASGYNKNEIKKAYRKAALRYHPDKNPDCDTSSIFHAIQASYEHVKLLVNDVSPRKSPRKEYKKEDYDFKRSEPFNFGKRKEEKSYEYIPKRDREDPPVGRRGRSNDGSNSARSYNDKYQQPKYSKSQADTSDISSETLRKLLKQCGFDARVIDTMTREQLVKKYAATTAHLHPKRKEEEKQKEMNSKFFDKEWNTVWEEEVKKEMDNTYRRRASADALRQERAEKMMRDLPQRSIKELRAMILAVGLSIDGCFEKDDLLVKLYEYYGLQPTKSSSSSSSIPDSYKKEESSSSRSKNNGINMTPAEAAMKSKIFKGMNVDVLKKVVQTSYDASDENMDKLYVKIDNDNNTKNNDSTRHSSKLDPLKFSYDTKSKENVKLKETTDKLKEVESKLNGEHSYKSTTNISDNTKSMFSINPELVEIAQRRLHMLYGNNSTNSASNTTNSASNTTIGSNNTNKTKDRHVDLKFGNNLDTNNNNGDDNEEEDLDIFSRRHIDEIEKVLSQLQSSSRSSPLKNFSPKASSPKLKSNSTSKPTIGRALLGSDDDDSASDDNTNNNDHMMYNFSNDINTDAVNKISKSPRYVNKMRMTTLNFATDSNTNINPHAEDDEIIANVLKNSPNKNDIDVPILPLNKVQQHSSDDANDIQDEVSFWINSAREDKGSKSRFELFNGDTNINDDIVNDKASYFWGQQRS